MILTRALEWFVPALITKHNSYTTVDNVLYGLINTFY